MKNGFNYKKLNPLKFYLHKIMDTVKQKSRWHLFWSPVLLFTEFIEHYLGYKIDSSL